MAKKGAAPPVLTTAQARAFLLRREGGLYHPGGAPADVLALVRQIGYLQLDPVAVVAAMHHLIARVRLPGYGPPHLDAALYAERTLVETFPHIAAVLPIADWRFYDNRLSAPYRIEGEDPALVARVHAAIAARGPLGSRHLTGEDDRRKMTYGWGSTPRAQAALHALARRGAILVHHREGVEKVYDLAERVLPPTVDTTPATPEERALHHAERELTYGGLVTGRTSTSGRRAFLRAAGGRAVPVAVATENGALVEFSIHAGERDAALAAAPITEGERRAHLLAPLDPLVHDRDRLEAVFGFAYRWEVYVPAAKRRYGPYTMPVLWGDRFVARLDPSLDRKRGVLAVRALWFEPDAPDDPALYTDLAAEIARFAVFHTATAVALGPVLPAHHDAPLRAALGGVVSLV